nr:endonuclease domain-containing protein [Hypericibacter adhaerens]
MAEAASEAMRESTVPPPVPPSPYVVDFICLSARLVVEVDGESHNHTIDRDVERSRWLESQGFRVVRFTNDDVRYRLEGVVQMIATELHGAPKEAG